MFFFYFLVKTFPNDRVCTQDYDINCAFYSDENLNSVESHVQMCRTTPPYLDEQINSFVKQAYTGVGDSDGNYLFRKDIGWLCAQRRVGRALGWLSHQYSSHAALPDVLLLVDDDTFVVRRYLSVLVVLAWLSLDLVIG